MILQDFSSLKNQIIDSERNGYGTDPEDVTTAFMEQAIVDPVELSNRFWDMFIVVVLVPVFDCGSSLYPQADDEMIGKILKNRQEINHRIFNLPLSAIQYKWKMKMRFFAFESQKLLLELRIL